MRCALQTLTFDFEAQDLTMNDTTALARVTSTTLMVEGLIALGAKDVRAYIPTELMKATDSTSAPLMN